MTMATPPMTGTATRAISRRAAGICAARRLTSSPIPGNRASANGLESKVDHHRKKEREGYGELHCAVLARVEPARQQGKCRETNKAAHRLSCGEADEVPQKASRFGHY